MAAGGAMRRWTCPECGAARAGYLTVKSARAARDRHMREKHRDGGSALAERRRGRDAGRQRARRGSALADLPQGSCLEYLCFVLCPQRRYDMYEQVRNHLVQSGFHISRITRREGIDLAKHPNVPRHQVVTRYVLESLLPELRLRFSSDSGLRYIFHLEDDCRLKRGKAFGDARGHALAAGSRIGWLGYARKDGEPRWQTHLLSFTPASIAHLERLLVEFRQCGLPAFDIVLWRFARDSPQSVCIAPESIAYQIGHTLTGRR